MHRSLKSLLKCNRCPRLVTHHRMIKQEFPGYHAAPVGAWGDNTARTLIVGLAPGLHGATRTGKAFVGDASGDFLFQSLYRTGLASNHSPNQAKLKGVRITNVVKCLPPGNTPQKDELSNCLPYLAAEISALHPAGLRKPRVIVCLGGVAHRQTCRALAVKGVVFKHGGEVEVRPKLTLISSFHPSRLNVNTGRITAQMLDDIFHSVRNITAG